MQRGKITCLFECLNWFMDIEFGVLKDRYHSDKYLIFLHSGEVFYRETINDRDRDRDIEMR